jgi:hypothetical protein
MIRKSSTTSIFETIGKYLPEGISDGSCVMNILIHKNLTLETRISGAVSDRLSRHVRYDHSDDAISSN